MKKLVSLMIALVVYATASSQTIIPKVGLSIANINSDSDTEEIGDPKSRLGLTVGVGFNMPITEVFSVQPELNYIKKGSKIDMDESQDFGNESMEIKGESSVGIDYLEIPVLTKFTFGTGTKFFLIAGPSFGIGLGGKTKLDAEVTYNYDGETMKFDFSGNGKVIFGETPEQEDLEDESFDAYIEKRVDVGAQFGCGVLIKEKVIIDVRYGLGFTDLSDEGTSKNRTIQITVGMPLTLRK